MKHIVNSKLWQLFPTWILEMVFAIGIFFGTAFFCDGNSIVLYGTALALTLTFGYVQISSRLQESQETLKETHVECFKKLNFYLVGKEIIWAILFFYMGAYPAIPGAFIFLLYPLWRNQYGLLRSL